MSRVPEHQETPHVSRSLRPRVRTDGPRSGVPWRLIPLELRVTFCRLRDRVLVLSLLLCSVLAVLSIQTVGATEIAWPPNVILIVADDLGYGDIGAFGGTLIKTPSLDALAGDGVVMEQFYASANICSPSRAGILTGRYAIRSGLAWDVVTAQDNHGLPQDEITVPELLREGGYSTGMIGKWHLGNRREYWPTRHGFESFYGVPHSNDMPDFALYRDEQKIEFPVEQSTLTRRYTREAIDFIRANVNSPFFLYLSHTFPHIPLFASPEFLGRSAAGLYGDVVEELDWSAGQIVSALKSLGLYDNTLILFTSDNGAWWEGSNGSSRGKKGSSWDGAYRVGLLASWPRRLQGAVRNKQLSNNTDLLPTIAAAAGVALPTNRVIDGRNLLPALISPSKTPKERRYFYYFNNEELVGIRDRHWKLLRRIHYRRHLGALDKFDQLPEFREPYWLLFDMRDPDPERYSMAREHPEIVSRLRDELERAERLFRIDATRDRETTFPR